MYFALEAFRAHQFCLRQIYVRMVVMLVASKDEVAEPCGKMHLKLIKSAGRISDLRYLRKFRQITS